MGKPGKAWRGAARGGEGDKESETETAAAAAAVSALNMTYDRYVMQHKNAITLCVLPTEAPYNMTYECCTFRLPRRLPLTASSSSSPAAPPPTSPPPPPPPTVSF